MSARLEAFLKKRLPSAAHIKVTDHQPLQGGFSCQTARFTAEIDGRPVHYVSRADVPDGQVMVQTDRLKEWRLLDALTRIGTVPLPRALFADEDGSELGARTIISEYASGGSLLARIRSADAADHPQLAEKLCDLAAEIHATDIAALDNVVARPPDWNTYIDSLIGLWKQAEARLSESIPMLRYVATWLDVNRPPATDLRLVHGEFQPANQVFDSTGRLLAIDWEFAHIGDPREDLGWCIFAETLQPPVLIGLDEQGFYQRYRARTGLSERIVNPLTVAYFSIAPSIKVFSGLLDAQQDLITRENGNIRAGYTVGAVTTACEQWFRAVNRIDAAMVPG
jgi:aminoglycoside phosphotransferase (APT) family kinase protein